MRNILAADIGATHSRFAHFQVYDGGELKLVEVQWLKTADSSSFQSLIDHLMAGEFSLKPGDADVAVFAIAGPVENNSRSSPPFISWDVDISQVQRDYGFQKVYLINDFVALAYACRSRIGEYAEKIKSGEAVKDAAAAVIGAGTALGKAVIISDHKSGCIAIPSEGGHANFPFESKREFEFQEFLLKELGDTYVTWNKVVCGKGLSHIHQFLTGKKLAAPDVIKKIIPESETLQWASRFYGRACRNFALESLAMGGVYIAGGVAARTPELVTHTAFADEFNRSDTLSDLLVRIPVFLIKEQNAGLWGAAVLGRQEL